jgi:hypothetical protein
MTDNTSREKVSNGNKEKQKENMNNTTQDMKVGEVGGQKKD